MTGWDYYNKYALINRKFHFVCTVLRIYRRAFLLENNLFFKIGIYHEDNLFTPLVCYYAQSVKVIPDLLYVYRIREGSITQSINKKRIFDIVRIANFLSDFFISKSDIEKTIVYREIAGEYFKGFMPEEIKVYGKLDYELKKLIQWDNYKIVSKYPRHKKNYSLLKISPLVFRIYIKIEKVVKRIVKFKL